MTDPTVLARVRPTLARRGLALAMLYMLGALLLYLAFSTPPASLAWLAFLTLAGLGALALGEAMRRATVHEITLTDSAVIDTAGRTLCHLDEVAEIDRGVFAIKPSNGFVLRLRTRRGFAWAPGLWWRIGRRVGIGGVTPAGESKFMAEMIAERLAGRDEPPGQA